MQLRFECPSCRQRNDALVVQGTSTLNCGQCDWNRPIRESDSAEGRPAKCLVCGCGDLWRQKNFPQALGLGMVALGALLSTIAWAAYLPTLALGVLLGFALVDVLLYVFMADVLVCYRCRARYAKTNFNTEELSFDLETAERYRQEAARVESSRRPAVLP